MTYDFELSASIPAEPGDVYDAWLSSERHSAMTGGSATIDPVVGGRYVAWDGFITGETIVLEPQRRVVQTWRTTKFTDADVDSQIDVRFEPEGGGTRLTVRHSAVPDDDRGYEEGGWERSYFAPMRAYFGATPS
jgi:activator of HSP90 ATPase